MKGIELKVARVRLGLRQEDVALGAGCSRARISQIEGLRRVPPRWPGRYQLALANCTPQPTVAGTVSAEADPRGRRA